jgi:hypothetical protein
MQTDQGEIEHLLVKARTQRQTCRISCSIMATRAKSSLGIPTSLKSSKVVRTYQFFAPDGSCTVGRRSPGEELLLRGSTLPVGDIVGSIPAAVGASANVCSGIPGCRECPFRFPLPATTELRSDSLEGSALVPIAVIEYGRWYQT